MWASDDFMLWATRTLRGVIQGLKLQKGNAEWIDARDSGKLVRRLETDTIKEFIKYAEGQGSKNASKYYMAITKMENKALFLVTEKYPNLREILATAQLDTIKMADRVVAKALKDGMEQSLHYKEIYKLAKVNVESLASVVGVTPAPKQLPKAKEQPALYSV